MGILTSLGHSHTILGMNARNLDYVTSFNPPSAIRLANDKLKTKRLLEERGLPTPRTMFLTSSWRDITNIPWGELPSSFVIKPARSRQGRGIIIIFGKSKRRQGMWIGSNGKRISRSDIEDHLFAIIRGAYSPSEDVGFIEERATVHSLLKPYASRGIPDIRVIVFNHIPVMAELRLPTRRSEGRSNLHMGGIGVGIDLAQGVTTYAIHMGKALRTLPESRVLLSGISLPAWDKVLLLAIEAEEAAGLGFAGIDIGIDSQSQPYIFEINATPGLAIQNANLSGLKEHLDRVRGLRVKSARQGIAIAQALFGGDMARQLETVSGKRVIGVFEPIQIETPKGLWDMTAKVDTGAYSSSIDQGLLKKLGLNKTAVYKKTVRSALGVEHRSFIELTFHLKGEKITTEVSVAKRSESRYDMLIGRKDLKTFLIDPALRKSKVV